MEVKLDKLENPSYVFRVLDDCEMGGSLKASCVIETITEDLCKIHALHIVEGITMRELRPKIQAKVMALGFTDYEFNRVYDGDTLKGKV